MLDGSGSVGADGGGEQQWIRAAVERFEAPLTSYARHVLGGDAERARDVVQEAFLRLIGQDHAKVGPHLTEWLYTVCRNLAIDVRRKERRMERAHRRRGRLGRRRRARAGRPGRAGRRDVARPAEHDAPAENQQECIRLKFQGGLSYKQISRVTNLTVTNVGFLIHTGLKTLRQRLTIEETKG